MKKLDLSYIVFLFLLLFPFIDFFTGIATWEGWPSIGLFLKGLLLLYAIIFLIKKKYCEKLFWVIFSLAVLFGIGYLVVHHTSLFSEISNLIKIFYFPIFLLFCKEYENPYINGKYMTIVCFLYLVLYILPYIFGLGHNISEVYPNKDLYLSYFYIGNELANVFIILVPIAFSYLLSQKKIVLVFFLILVVFMLALLGTKAMYISIFLFILYFLMFYRKKIGVFLKKHFVKILFLFVLGVLLICIFLPRSSLIQNIATTLEYYDINSVVDMFSFERIDQVVFSNRLTFLSNVHQEYFGSSLVEKFLGLGRVGLLEIKDVEIDFFDIFYSIGIVGMLVYLAVFWYAIYGSKLKGISLFVFCLLIVISFFSGHVLLSPMVSTYLALLVNVSKNEEF